MMNCPAASLRLAYNPVSNAVLCRHRIIAQDLQRPTSCISVGSTLALNNAVAPPALKECALISEGLILTRGPMTAHASRRAFVMCVVVMSLVPVGVYTLYRGAAFRGKL